MSRNPILKKQMRCKMSKTCVTCLGGITEGARVTPKIESHYLHFRHRFQPAGIFKKNIQVIRNLPNDLNGLS